MSELSSSQAEGWHDGRERYAACDDEGDIAQYPGMDAFFNLK